MNDADNRPAVAGQVERPVRPAAEARWYCLDRDGVAMLCKDEEDARAEYLKTPNDRGNAHLTAAQEAENEQE